MPTIVLTHLLASVPAGPVVPGTVITNTLTLHNATGSDSGAFTVAFVDTNGSDFSLSWTNNTVDTGATEDAASGSLGVQNTGGTTPFDPTSLAMALSAGAQAVVTFTSTVPITWTSGAYTDAVVITGAGLTGSPLDLSTSVNVSNLEIAAFSVLEVFSEGMPISGLAVSAASANTPLVYSADGLPLGLTINSSTGVVSGTPTKIGDFSTVFTVEDSVSYSLSTDAIFEIIGYLGQPVFEGASSESIPRNELIVPAQQTWVVGVAVPTGLSAAVRVGNNFTGTIIYTAGNLPLGVTMNTSGVFSGAPVVPRTASIVSVKAVDANGVATYKNFEVIVVTDAADATANVGGPVFTSMASPCNPALPAPATPSLAQMFASATAMQQAFYPIAT